MGGSKVEREWRGGLGEGGEQKQELVAVSCNRTSRSQLRSGTFEFCFFVFSFFRSSLDVVARGWASLDSLICFAATVFEDSACLICRHGPLSLLQDYRMLGPHLSSGDCCGLPRRNKDW